MSKQLKNPRHEHYARYRSRGYTQKESYHKCFPNNELSIDSCASELEARPEVSQRIQDLIDDHPKLGDLSRSELIDFLQEVVNSPPGTVNENSRIAQEVDTIQNGDQRRTKVRVCDKLKAIELIAKLTGRQEPERTETKTHITLERIVDTNILEQLTQGYTQRLTNSPRLLEEKSIEV